MEYAKYGCMNQIPGAVIQNLLLKWAEKLRVFLIEYEYGFDKQCEKAVIFVSEAL